MLDMQLLESFGLAAAGAAGLSALAVNYVRGKKQALPPDANVLATRAQEQRSNREGRQPNLVLLLVGSYGVNMGAKVIDAFLRAGCLDDLSCVIAIELDDAGRADFRRNLPAELLARLVMCHSSLLKGGLQNRSLEEVEAPDLRKFWQPLVKETLDRATRQIRGGSEPAAIIEVAGNGGHTVLSVAAGKKLQDEFPRTPMFVVTAIPTDDMGRQRFPAGVGRFVRENFARFFLVTDNKRGAPANDAAVATALAGLWVAPKFNDMAQKPWNLLNSMMGEAHTGIVAPSYWQRMIPAQRAGAPAMSFRRSEYFSSHDACVTAVLDGLTEVMKPGSKRLDVAMPAPSTSRYVIVTLPLVSESLMRVKDQVETALMESGWFEDDGNRQLFWARRAEPGDSLKYVAVSVTVLEAAVGGIASLPPLLRSDPAEPDQLGQPDALLVPIQPVSGLEQRNNGYEPALSKAVPVP